MRRGIRSSIAVAFALVLGLHDMRAASFHSPGAAARPHNTASGLESPQGQTRTLLPDGTWLVVGGEGEQGPLNVAAIEDLAGSKTGLPASLHYPRAWHTATLLPEGTVLILGGVDAHGTVVEHSESFDPSTGKFTVLPSTGLQPRAYHSATVLTDGRLLVVGGISSEGEVIHTAELWDPRTGTATPVPVELSKARRGQIASLLPDGRVLLWGGFGVGDEVLKDGELFDPDTQSFFPIEVVPPEAEELAKSPNFVGSAPEDGSRTVPVTALIGLRFSVPLRVQIVESGTVSLTGNDETVPAKVIPAEGGLLVFVTPTQALQPGTDYTVSITGLRDRTGRSVPDAQVNFTTADDGEQWIPGSGDWSTGRGNSQSQSLPPLEAPAGVTALAGQALKLNGDPLQSVTLVIAGQRTRTDNTGRFLLQGLPAGHQVLLIDGRTADRPGRAYGVFEYGADIKAGLTNVLPFTIWMTLIDTAHAVAIPSPTPAETTVTSPLLPGLELHIPANTVIYDDKGNAVTKVSITPIPVDRPPFPLPAGVNVPIYFTIQPGAAYIKVLDSGEPQGARLIYPNPGRAAVGTRFSFWDYNADQKGWYVYGHGSVDATQEQVIPDPGVVIYEFTGAMAAGSGFAHTSGPAPRDSTGGDPVDLGTGLFVYRKTDLSLPDVLPITVTRTYRQGDSQQRSFGIGTMLNYDVFLVGDKNPYTYLDLVLPDGGRIHYMRISSGTGFADAVYEHTFTPTIYNGSMVSWNGNGWNLRLKNRTTYQFPPGDSAATFQQAALTGIVDRYGNQVTLTRAPGSSLLTQITSPNGRFITLTYDSNNRIAQAQDNIGRIVKYAYDASNRLFTVTDANNGVTTFTYDLNANMLTIKDARQIVYLTNQYDAFGRVYRQTLADNGIYQFNYTDGKSQCPGSMGFVGMCDDPTIILKTDVVDPRGYGREVVFAPRSSFPDGYVQGGYPISDTFALGMPEQQVFTYNRGWNGFEAGAPSNLLQSVTDPLNRTTSYTYNSVGNVTSITRLTGTSNAVTTNFTYESIFSQLTSVTDPLGDTYSFSHDGSGNLTTATDPLGNQTTFSYNSAGQPVSATDPIGETAQFSYDHGDLVGIVDPLKRSVVGLVDSGGRLLSITDSLGNITQYSYDPLNELTNVTDPQGNVTSFAYDPNGNLLSVTDARQNRTTYTPDSMDRVATRKDALQKVETYQYDGNGNLTQFTDRKGQVTTYGYDALNRLNFAGFGTQPGPTYQSTITYTYDGGNRLTKVVDSVSGTITPGYDGLDRLTSETTPQGSVSYTYDNADRRRTLTVAGQPSSLGYTYDNADRLAQVTQGSSTANVAYDHASRRTSLTLPDGVSMDYSYDAGSELTGIIYQSTSATLGNLTYAYDMAGRRAGVSGSFAATGLPLAVGSATYNADNQPTQWGTANPVYDLNGNLTNDGLNTYVWDARNQLASITASGTTIGSFQYDPFGRRVSKTVAGGTTGFLYDGVNVVQELSGSTPTANLMTGLGVDEVLTRADSSGTMSFLTDALGSTLALANSSGSIQTSYTYEPFGRATVSGTASGNSFQFSGRENDGSGLYYYRARYYSPAFSRFISEDPIGFWGGQTNLHAYAANNPLGYIDPKGTSLPGIHIQESRRAARAVGYDEDTAQAIAEGVAEVDERPGSQETDPFHAHWHAMAGRKSKDRYESCGAAYSGAAEQLRLDMKSGDENAALHLIQDSYSHLYGPWNGGLPVLHIPGPAHIQRDSVYFPEAEQMSERYLDAYKSGRTYLSPEAYLAPKPTNCN